MCRRATRSFCRSRSRGPRSSERSDIFIGVNALDYSGYPDCRPEYIAAFERMANLATRGGVEGTNPIRIRTPLIDLTKARDHSARTSTRRRLLDDSELLRSRRGRRGVRPLRCVSAAAEGLRGGGRVRSRAYRAASQVAGSSAGASPNSEHG